MTDQLEASLDAVAQGERIEGLAQEVAALKGALLAQRRPALDGVKGGMEDPARAAFVDRYLRQGHEAGVELKSFAGASGTAGGYAVPREIDQIIDATLKSLSPIRAIANVVRTGSAGYRKLVTSGGIVSGWASETGARGETGTPAFNEIVPPSGELFANPAASQAMLDDAQFDVEGWLAGEIAREFAAAEGSEFVKGDGINKPRGFLTYAATAEADGVRAFGSLQYVPSGAAGGFAASHGRRDAALGAAQPGGLALEQRKRRAAGRRERALCCAADARGTGGAGRRNIGSDMDIRCGGDCG